jgi:hypothetical protein
MHFLLFGPSFLANNTPSPWTPFFQLLLYPAKLPRTLSTRAYLRASGAFLLYIFLLHNKHAAMLCVVEWPTVT